MKMLSFSLEAATVFLLIIQYAVETKFIYKSSHFTDYMVLKFTPEELFQIKDVLFAVTLQ